MAGSLDLRLTPRDRDVIRCAARGLSREETAKELGISPGTVSHHLANLRYKLGSFDRVLLPGMGLLLGLVTPEEVMAGAKKFLDET